MPYEIHYKLDLLTLDERVDLDDSWIATFKLYADAADYFHEHCAVDLCYINGVNVTGDEFAADAEKWRTNNRFNTTNLED